MSADDSDRELQDLRARVYGPGGSDSMDSAQLARLQELETARRPVMTTDVAAEPPPADATDTPEPVSPSSTSDGAAVPLVGAPASRVRRVVAAALVVLAAVAVGVAIGFFVRPLAAPGSASVAVPELYRPQTEQDRIPGAGVIGFDRYSSRFVGSVDGYNVYLARAVGYEGLCVVMTETDGTGLASVGCGDGITGGLSIGVTPNIDIVVGTPPIPIDGDPIPLSESVTAYGR